MTTLDPAAWMTDTEYVRLVEHQLQADFDDELHYWRYMASRGKAAWIAFWMDWLKVVDAELSEVRKQWQP